MITMQQERSNEPLFRKGVPVVNPSGKYVVRLWLNGVYRKVCNCSKIHFLDMNSILKDLRLAIHQSFSSIPTHRVQLRHHRVTIVTCCNDSHVILCITLPGYNSHVL